MRTPSGGPIVVEKGETEGDDWESDLFENEDWEDDAPKKDGDGADEDEDDWSPDWGDDDDEWD